MDIKTLRAIHLYLGCFFAPILIFFIVSGCLQTFQLHRSKKNGSYTAPLIIKASAEVHQRQRWLGTDDWPTKSSKTFQFFIFLMSIGITTTTVLGIIMAFKY